MASESKFLYTAAMDVPHSKEALFNEVYDQEHIPYLAQVPGVISIARFTTQPLNMVLGGKKRNIVIEGQPKHTAMYEIVDPAVLLSKEWAEAVDHGRWSSEVREHTFNRRQVLLKKT